jgi:hypothetical protein
MHSAGFLSSAESLFHDENWFQKKARRKACLFCLKENTKSRWRSSFSATDIKKVGAKLALLRPLERVKGVEPSYRPWEGRVLPMNYTRERWMYYIIQTTKIQPYFGLLEIHNMQIGFL